MRLDERLPEEICGIKIETNFRVILGFLCADTEEKKRDALLNIFYNGVPENIGDEFNQFIAAGEEVKDDDDEEKSFDFVIDAGRIYSSFFQDYGINLFSENLHWWEFMELFKGLSENTIIKKVIDARTKKITPEMGKEEREYWIKMKQQFSLGKFEGVYSD